MCVFKGSTSGWRKVYFKIDQHSVILNKDYKLPSSTFCIFVMVFKICLQIFWLPPHSEIGSMSLPLENGWDIVIDLTQSMTELASHDRI